MYCIADRARALRARMSLRQGQVVSGDGPTDVPVAGLAGNWGLAAAGSALLRELLRCGTCGPSPIMVTGEEASTFRAFAQGVSLHASQTHSNDCKIALDEMGGPHRDQSAGGGCVGNLSPNRETAACSAAVRVILWPALALCVGSRKFCQPCQALLRTPPLRTHDLPHSEYAG
jgi:hypothetical protein